MGKEKAKEQIKLRYRNLKDGIKRVYLDVYSFGKHSHIFIERVILPENHAGAEDNNAAVLAKAESKKQALLKELAIDIAQIKDRAFIASETKLVDWLKLYGDVYKKLG